MTSENHLYQEIAENNEDDNALCSW